MPRFRLGLKRGLRPQLLAVLGGLAVVGAGSAHAQQPPPYSCGDIPNPNSVPKIQATFRTNAGLNNGEFDCMAWQDFIYFMWPAQPGQRGAPKPSPARLGDAGPTVWETYRTADTGVSAQCPESGPVESGATDGDAARFAGATSLERRGAPLDDDVESLARGTRQYPAQRRGDTAKHS